MSTAVAAEALADHIYPLQRENNARRAHAMTFSCLGKLAATDRTLLDQWRDHLEGLIRSAVVSDPSPAPLVIGLAESGIVPSALCHQILRAAGVPARWICSTRRPARGVAFTESHSHAPDQTLPLPAEPPSELWFVEDEITTGRTVRRLARRLCEITGVRRVKIFAFADLRGPEATRELDAALSQAGLRFSVHPLVRMREPVPADESRSMTTTPEPDRPAAPEGETDSRLWHLPSIRPALGALTEPPEVSLDGPLRGSLLVVGEAVDLGLALVRQNPALAFCHVTLSPWRVDGVHIHRRLDIPGGYYLYNPQTLSPPLFILADPADAAVGRAVRQKLAEIGLSAEPLDLPAAMS